MKKPAVLFTSLLAIASLAAACTNSPEERRIAEREKKVEQQTDAQKKAVDEKAYKKK
jgi:hypothetical protein